MVGDEADDGREHIPEVQIDVTMARARHSEHLASVQVHMAAARPAASILVARAQALVRHGVDLRHPERVSDFVDDQIKDAVRAATVHECGCVGAQGAAAAALLVEVTRALACELEGRES